MLTFIFYYHFSLFHFSQHYDFSLLFRCFFFLQIFFFFISVSLLILSLYYSFLFFWNFSLFHFFRNISFFLSITIFFLSFFLSFFLFPLNNFFCISSLSRSPFASLRPRLTLPQKSHFPLRITIFFWATFILFSFIVESCILNESCCFFPPTIHDFLWLFTNIFTWRTTSFFICHQSE